MVDLYVDNIPIKVLKNSTVLQACSELGIDIPRFCFHERLLIAGNCRTCLVELEKSPKPVASCALPVVEGMKVFTSSPLVKKAQEGVLEFLLLNHPLDCPICDQGGECDLQDQAISFGSDSSRYYSHKRGVEDKYCGPLVKTIMTRCIHCTRCVRFLSEIAGVPDLGTLGRGTDTQIGTYLDKALSSELSGNVIDLCPVGALTSRTYSFKGRPWELKSTNSIDTLDSCGSNIVINSKDSKVMRILPRLNEDINEEWLSDKSRFSYDGLIVERFGVPILRQELRGLKYQKRLGWPNVFDILLLKISKDIYNLSYKSNIIFGHDVDLETVLTIKTLFNKLNCFSLYSDLSFCSNSLDLFYKLSCRMKGVKSNDLCILVNCNTRFEVPMFNMHLRKAVNRGSLDVSYFGPATDLTFKSPHLGLDNASFYDLINGKHPFSKKLIKSKNPLILVSGDSFSNKELVYINNILADILSFSRGCLSVLSTNSADTALKDVGINSIKNLLYGKIGGMNFYINSSLGDRQVSSLFNRINFSVYCGTHNVLETKKSNLLLPTRAYTEKKAGFVNLEGLLQQTNKSVSYSKDSRGDWEIFNSFFFYLNLVASYSGLLKINYYDLYSLKTFFYREYPFVERTNHYNNNLFYNLNGEFGFLKVSTRVYKTKIFNFYKTGILPFFSSAMEACYNITRKG